MMIKITEQHRAQPSMVYPKKRHKVYHTPNVMYCLKVCQVKYWQHAYQWWPQRHTKGLFTQGDLH